MRDRSQYSTCIHEAAHACAALSVYRDGVDLIECPRSPGGTTDDGLAWGRCNFKTPMDARYVVTLIIGYMAEDRLCGVHPPVPVWPPPASEVADERLERLGAVVTELGLTAEEYELAVTFATRLLDNPEWCRRVRLVASALEVCPVMDGSDVTAILGLEAATA
jgi:hypothetical protein